MTCRNCGQDWCWLCGGEYGYNHYERSLEDVLLFRGCGGLQMSSIGSYGNCTYIFIILNRLVLWIAAVLFCLVSLPVFLVLQLVPKFEGRAFSFQCTLFAQSNPRFFCHFFFSLFMIILGLTIFILGFSLTIGLLPITCIIAEIKICFNEGKATIKKAELRRNIILLPIHLSLAFIGFLMREDDD